MSPGYGILSRTIDDFETSAFVNRRALQIPCRCYDAETARCGYVVQRRSAYTRVGYRRGIAPRGFHRKGLMAHRELLQLGEKTLSAVETHMIDVAVAHTITKSLRRYSQTRSRAVAPRAKSRWGEDGAGELSAGVRSARQPIGVRGHPA